MESLVGRHWLLWAFVDLRWPSLAVVGRRWPSLAAVGFRGPALAFVGRHWLLWAFVDLRWLLWAVVGLRWLSLAAVGFRGPALACVGCCGLSCLVVIRIKINKKIKNTPRAQTTHLASFGPFLSLLAFAGHHWLLWAFVDLRWPSLAAVGLR